MSKDTPATYRALVVAFTDFLTVSIHTILYEREIYPRTSFVATKRYNHAVRQNRHPEVCEWINDAVHCVEQQMLKCTVDRVAVVIMSKTEDALERFMFDVSQFPIVPHSELDTPMRRNGVVDNDLYLPIVDMEEQFRGVLTRLVNCENELRALPTGCTFTLAIELKEDNPRAPISHPQAWIPAVLTGEDDTPIYSENSNDKGPIVTPLRTMRSGRLVFESWIEESDTKLTTKVSDFSSQSDYSLP